MSVFLADVLTSVDHTMGAADMFTDKIIWVDLQKECADKLSEMARELGDHRKRVNTSQVSGSSVSVGGAAAVTECRTCIKQLVTGGARRDAQSCDTQSCDTQVPVYSFELLSVLFDH